MKDITPLNQQFIDVLQSADQHTAHRQEYLKSVEKVHIVGAGGAITAAYEQLRNAAEYTEEHLLLQRAIRRFYKRMFLSRDMERVADSGQELAIELTLAGYLPNDHIAVTVVKQISHEATQYFAAYEELLKKYPVSDVEEWTIAPLAVQIESQLTNHARRSAFVQFAYHYFMESVDAKKVFGGKLPENYDALVFIAVHRMLLKSDNPTIRHALLERYQARPAQLEQFVQLNGHLDKLLDSDPVEKLGRIVTRRGAPLRVLWRMVEEVPELPDILGKRERFLAAYESQIENEYNQINQRINRGVVKSVIFLIITKFLIGISLEIPYDYIVHGGIVWTPLLINLFFPPIYMILLRFTLVLPGRANTNALVDKMDELLFSTKPTVSLERTDVDKRYSSAFNVFYVLLILAVFGGVAWLLWQIGFSLMHLAIFFIFLSTASFLGFRLSRLIREIEAVDADQSGLAMVRDFLYLPFVVVGRWMSEKYAKVNVIAMILDMVIELPLKTVIRLVQQWGRFISSKKDEL